MKKALALAGILALSATIAFAVTAPTNTAGTGTFGTSYMRANESGDLAYTATNVGAGVTFTARLSANVYMSLQSSSDGSYYLVSTIHGSGNKYYATGSGDSRLFMQESTSDTLITPPTVASSSTSVDWTGWTAVK